MQYKTRAHTSHVYRMDFQNVTSTIYLVVVLFQSLQLVIYSQGVVNCYRSPFLFLEIVNISRLWLLSSYAKTAEISTPGIASAISSVRRRPQSADVSSPRTQYVLRDRFDFVRSILNGSVSNEVPYSASSRSTASTASASRPPDTN